MTDLHRNISGLGVVCDAVSRSSTGHEAAANRALRSGVSWAGGARTRGKRRAPLALLEQLSSRGLISAADWDRRSITPTARQATKVESRRCE